MNKSHAGDSEQPTARQLKEFFAQIESGAITRQRLQGFLAPAGSGPVDLSEAKEHFGTGNFFGPNEWLEFFGKEFSLPKVPKIPWTREQLTLHSAQGEHFLFLIPNRLNGKPLTLKVWFEKFSGRDTHPTFEDDSVSGLLGSSAWSTEADLGWYYMPRTVIYGLHTHGYRTPTTLSRVIANTLYYWLNAEYFDSFSWARTSEQNAMGGEILVRGHPEKGIRIYGASGVLKEARGTAASRIP